MSKSTPTEGSVEVDHFARVFVSDPGRIPPQATAYKSDRGHYYRLELDSIPSDAASALVQKADQSFERVEVVGQVIENGTITKERRYVDSIHEVPDGHTPERGPQGGIYYETQGQAPAGQGGSMPGGVSEEVGYSGQPVLAVQFDDVDEGDRIAFETADGDRDMGEVVGIDSDERLVTVSSGDGQTDVAAAPLEGVEEKEDAGVTSSTPGVHSARYSPDDDPENDDEDEEDLGIGGEVSKAHRPGPLEGDLYCEEEDATFEVSEAKPDWLCPWCGGDIPTSWSEGDYDDFLDEYAKAQGFDADVYRVIPGEGDDTFESDDQPIGVAVDFPNHDVYVDWRNGVFPDELDNAHVSIYGSIEDLTNATGNRVEQVDTIDVTNDSLSKAVQKAEDGEDVWTYYYGPQGGEGWMNMRTGEIRYQKQRPGQAPEDPMVEDDWVGDGWAEPPDDLTELREGQHVEFYDEGAEEYYEGDIEVLDEDGQYARIDGEGPNGIIGPSGPDDLTAVEETDDGEGAPDGWEPIPHETEALESLNEGDPIVYEDHAGNRYESRVSLIDQGDAIHSEEDHLVFPDKMDAWVPGDVAEQFPSDEEGEESEPPAETTEPEDLLEDAGVDIGDQFEYEDMQVEVVGTTSMVADGEPSHIEVAPLEGDVTDPLPIHPNSVPEDAGSEDDILGDIEDEIDSIGDEAVGEEVDTDEMDEDVQDEFVSDDPDEAAQELLDEFDDDVPEGNEPAEASGWQEYTADYEMSEYDPSDVEDWGDLSDFGFPSGVTAHNMEVGALPSWEQGSNEGLVFKTEYGPDGEKTDLGHRQMVTYTVGDALGGEMPEHVGHPEDDGYVAAEGIEGEDIGSAPGGYLEQVDPEQWYEQAAVQIILGNNDAHMQNVKVTPEGDLVFHDIDHSAGDITSDFVGNKPQYDSAIDRVLGELTRSGQYVVDDDKEEMKQKMLEHAKEKAQEVNGTEELNDALSEAQAYNEDHVGNVASNVTRLAAGDVSWP
jgi:hypothetical protein